MKTLKIKLSEPLREVLGKKSKIAVARETGISVPTIQAIANDRWRYIHRHSIERIMDYLGLDAKDVFESADATFWENIKQALACTFICGSRKEPAAFRIPRYALEAARQIQSFFQDLGAIDSIFGNDMEVEEEELINIAKTQNCVVIGSPESNRATEVLLSRFFGAKPFTPEEKNRNKIPFGFGWRRDTEATQQSSLTYSPAARTQMKDRSGLAWQGGQAVVEFRDSEDFKVWETDEALDAGLVFVADQPFGTQKLVKLIVLAGVGGIGTVAAANALIRDFSELQPRPQEKCVYGVVQARYSKKPSEVDGRTYKSFSWLYRNGGRNPISIKANAARIGKR